jgi:protein phosphatase 1L
MLPAVRTNSRPRGVKEPEKSALPVGVCSKQGKRPYQEDAFSICAYLKPVRSKAAVTETHYFGLYDGHAGGRCSKFLSSSLSAALAEDPSYGDNLPQALKRSFHTVNDQFLRVADQMNLQDGSTCLVVLIRDDKYMIANVGDCRAVLISNGKPIQLSKDQKPTNIEEQRRIAKLGGTIVNCMGISRVNGVLAVARAFGNRNLRHVIRPDAEITQRAMNEGDEYLIIASDGMWDVLSNRDVANFCGSTAASNMRASAIAEELVATALARGSMDNTTCICVKLSDFVKRQLSNTGVGNNYNDKEIETGNSDLSPPIGGRSSPNAMKLRSSALKFDGDHTEKPLASLSHFRSDLESNFSAGGGATTQPYRPGTTYMGARNRSYSDHSDSKEASNPRNYQHQIGRRNQSLTQISNDHPTGQRYQSSPIQGRKRVQETRSDGSFLRRPTTQGGPLNHAAMEMSGSGFQSLSEMGGNSFESLSAMPSAPANAAGGNSWTSSFSGTSVGGSQARLLHSPINLRTQQNRFAAHHRHKQI